MEQFHVTPVDQPKKPLGKRSAILVLIAIIFLLGTTAATAFFAFQNNAANSKITQLNADKAKLNSDIAKLRTDHVAESAGNQAAQDAPKNANNLSQILDEIYRHPAELTSDDKSTVMEVAKQHFEASTIPDGARIMVGYEMVKPASQPSGEIRALVYWPGTENERPQFLDVIKDAGKDVWRADDSY